MNAIPEKQHRTTALPAGGEFSHLMVAVSLGGLAIALVAIASWVLNEPAAVFTREPQSALHGRFYVGSFSNLGGVVWFAVAAILSFAVSLKPLSRAALTIAAWVTWAMGLDDIFLLHDSVYFRLHIHEIVVNLAYFGAIALVVLRYHRQLERSTVVGIAIAVGFWGLSVVLDHYFNQFGQLAEDGAKFIGIAVWAAAWIRQSYNDINKLPRFST